MDFFKISFSKSCSVRELCNQIVIWIIFKHESSKNKNMELEVNITGPHYRHVSSALAEWHIILTGRATNFDMGSFCSSLLFFFQGKKAMHNYSQTNMVH